MTRKYSKAASQKVETAMHERKKGTLRSGSGKTVKGKAQAITIALSQRARPDKRCLRRVREKQSGNASVPIPKFA